MYDSEAIAKCKNSVYCLTINAYSPHGRFPADIQSNGSMNEALPDLVARFRIKHGLFRKEVVEASVFELDNFGCVMKTDKVFNPGDTVVLDLIMDMPFDNIEAEGVPGLITERRKHCSNFFYSIDFTGYSDNASSSFSSQLQRIRDVVKKKQSLRSRRSSGPNSGFQQMA